MLETEIKSTGTGKFFFPTFLLVVGFSFTLIVFSLFGKDLNLGFESFDSTSMVAPAVEEVKPEEIKVEKKTTSAPKVVADVRQKIVQNIEESPQIPEKISNVKSTVPPRRANTFTIEGDTNVDAPNAAPRSVENTGKEVGITSGGNGTPTGTGEDDTPPVAKTPTPKPTPVPTVEVTPVPTPTPIKTVVSGGVVNGKARNLVVPVYPPSAKAVNARGQVSVKVLISENGDVISATATNGHVLLRQSAEQAAKASKFTPTFLSNQKVKVEGTIIYNFQ